MNTDKFFVRLNLEFSDLVNETESLTFSHGYNETNGNEHWGTLNYFDIDLAAKEKIKARLPYELQSMIRNIRVAVIKGQIIMPHIDHRGQVSINYHIATGDAKTTFWSSSSTAQPFTAKGEKTSNIYDYKDLFEECHYVAGVGSCYLLNTGKIHDVTMPTTDSTRKLLQFTFEPTIDYDTVLEKMINLNLLELRE